MADLLREQLESALERCKMMEIEREKVDSALARMDRSLQEALEAQAEVRKDTSE